MTRNLERALDCTNINSSGMRFSDQTIIEAFI